MPLRVASASSSPRYLAFEGEPPLGETQAVRAVVGSWTRPTPSAWSCTRSRRPRRSSPRQLPRAGLFELVSPLSDEGTDPARRRRRPVRLRPERPRPRPRRHRARPGPASTVAAPGWSRRWAASGGAALGRVRRIRHCPASCSPPSCPSWNRTARRGRRGREGSAAPCIWGAKPDSPVGRQKAVCVSHLPQTGF